MNKLILVVAISCIIFVTGCNEAKQARTGFISDYSKLKAVSDDSYRYLDKAALSSYKKFIVDDIQVHFFAGASAIEAKSDGKLTSQELENLTNYFHAAIVKAIINSGCEVVTTPGRGVARLRIALTDIKETDALNVLPQASLLGAGVGGAALEFEVVDSLTNKQIAAVVESRKGSRVPFSNLGDWGTAKGIMDDWAARIEKALKVK